MNLAESNVIKEFFFFPFLYRWILSLFSRIIIVDNDFDPFIFSKNSFHSSTTLDFHHSLKIIIVDVAKYWMMDWNELDRTSNQKNHISFNFFLSNSFKKFLKPFAPINFIIILQNVCVHPRC